MSYYPTNTSAYGNITINAPTWSTSNVILSGGATSVGYTVPLTITGSSNYSYSSDIQVGKTRITDDDIMFGNVSLKSVILKFEERLAILIPNPKIEAEFEELKVLREQYIELEKKLTEQKEVWDVLKK